MSAWQQQTPLARPGDPGTSWAARNGAMKPMREMGDREWVWDQPRRFAEYFELRASGELLATLSHEAGFSPLRPFHMETAEGRWDIKRSHLFRFDFAVRRPGDAEPLAQYKPNWIGRGKLLVPNGLEYSWKLVSILKFEWGWMDAGGSPLILFRPMFALARARAHVEVTGTALRMPELPLLSVLGWLLMLSSRRHAS